MKKTKIFFTLLSGALALLFASCSGLNTSDGDVTEGYTDKNVGAKTITMNVASDDDLLIFPNADAGARTILPAAVNASDNSKVKFYLSYYDTLSATPTAEQWAGEVNFVGKKVGNDGTNDVLSSTVGTIAKSFEISVYKFTLYCVPASVSPANPGDAKTNSMFIGYANADLRYADEITFYMSADKATGKGTVKLTLYTSNTQDKTTTNLWKVPKNYVVSAGIYKKTEDTIVYPSTDPTAVLGTVSGSTVTALTAATAIDAYEFGGTSGAAVEAGSYNFVVIFRDTQGTSAVDTDDKYYYWSDEIVILPMQTTEADVFIPEVINKIPDAPSSFFAAYDDPVSKEADYYYAYFAWSDNSNTEKSFEIDLAEVNDNYSNIATSGSVAVKNLPTDDSSWTSTLQDYTATGNVTTYDWLKYQTSQFNPDPETYSLIKNNKVAVFKLPLGSRYIARIRAVNDVGPSPYAYLHIASQFEDAGTLKYTKDSSTIDGEAGYGFDVATGKITFKEKDYEHASSGVKEDTTAELTRATALAGATGTINPFGYGSYTVNRFRITYQLDGGEFKGTYTANPTPPDPNYAALTKLPATVVYKTQRASAADTVIGEELLNPDGDTHVGTAYLATDGSEVAATEVNLILEDATATRKFSKWLLESTTDITTNRYPVTKNYWDTSNSKYVTSSTGLANPDVRNIPDVYTGHNNLTLFANYAVDTTMNVTLADYTEYKWACTVASGSVTASDVSFKYKKDDGSGTYTDATKLCSTEGEYVQVSQSNSPSVSFILNTSTMDYDNVKLRIRPTNAKVTTYTYNKDWTKGAATYTAGTYSAAGVWSRGSWSASPASWDINVKAWKPGVYEATLIGTTKKYPDKYYTLTITINVID